MPSLTERFELRYKAYQPHPFASGTVVADRDAMQVLASALEAALAALDEREAHERSACTKRVSVGSTIYEPAPRGPYTDLRELCTTHARGVRVMEAVLAGQWWGEQAEGVGILVNC